MRAQHRGTDPGRLAYSSRFAIRHTSQAWDVHLTSSLHMPLQVAVTASMGTAAINIKGFTIHSFAGVGLAAGRAEELAKRVWFNRVARKHWQDVAVLVIDEGSMVSDELFDKLEYVARWGWWVVVGWKEVWQAGVRGQVGSCACSALAMVTPCRGMQADMVDCAITGCDVVSCHVAG